MPEGYCGILSICRMAHFKEDMEKLAARVVLCSKSYGM